MKKSNILFKRFLIFIIVLSIIFQVEFLKVIAVEKEKEFATIIFDAQGNISYQDSTKYTTSSSPYIMMERGGLVITESYGKNEIDEQISTYAAAPVSKVNLTAITFEPYKNVCYIEAIFPNNKVGHSSGILVSKNLVLASAHGIYQPNEGGYPVSISVYPGQYVDGEIHTPWGYASNFVAARIPSQYVNNGQTDEYDWSLIQVNTNFNSWQSFGYAPNHSNLSNRTVRAIGYREDRNMYTATGTINYTSEKIIHTSIGTEHGQSGGPIIDIETGAVIGIVKGAKPNIFGGYQYNISTRIDEYLYNIINNDIANGGIK